MLLLFLSAALLASPADCSRCHKTETEAFEQSTMARALERAGTAITPPTKIEGYTYQIDRATYIVTDGRDTLRIPIDWAFGQGSAGRTWLFQREGRWYESRVSYFSALHGLDITIGQQSITPHNLLEAAGRLIPPDEVGKCFDCHATDVVKSDVSHMTPGVQCERCHGATEAHLRVHGPMRKLAALTAEEMSDFCGQCHRTWSQISINGPRGILNVRFQPYRLAGSKCYDAADNRIRCTACHDPHQPLKTNAASYDAKCQACHTKKTCRVAAKGCVTCHMPQLDLPGAHKKFTDHRIRIVKANEPYPD